MPDESERRHLAQEKYDKALRRLWRVLGVLAVGSIAAMLVGGYLMSPDKDKDLWFELFKGGVTLFLATVVGGIVSLLVENYKHAEDEKVETEKAARATERATAEQDFTTRRDREIDRQANERRLTDLRLRLLRDIVRTYNDVKAVRRRLRAFGLYEPKSSLNALQIEGFHNEMSNLLDAQLTFEALKYEVVDTRAFGEPLTADIEEMLTTAEKYLNSSKARGVLGEWQDKRGYAAITTGCTAADFQKLTLLQNFMAPQRDGKGFELSLTRPIHEITKRARQQLYPDTPISPSGSSSGAP